MEHRPHAPSETTSWSILCTVAGQPVMVYTRVDHELAARADFVYRFGCEPCGHPAPMDDPYWDPWWTVGASILSIYLVGVVLYQMVATW